jgi:hypothetical protein
VSQEKVCSSKRQCAGAGCVALWSAAWRCVALWCAGLWCVAPCGSSLLTGIMCRRGASNRRTRRLDCCDDTPPSLQFYGSRSLSVCRSVCLSVGLSVCVPLTPCLPLSALLPSLPHPLQTLHRAPFDRPPPLSRSFSSLDFFFCKQPPNTAQGVLSAHSQSLAQPHGEAGLAIFSQPDNGRHACGHADTRAGG